MRLRKMLYFCPVIYHYSLFFSLIMRRNIILLMLLVATPALAQRTPTMGWSSWNTFALNINEDLIKQQADAMHNSGLQAAGYQFVNIDDGYWDGRGADGHLRLNEKLFPSGMRSLVDYIHRLGLKAGIYSDAGDNTCGSGNRQAWGLGVGLAGYEEQDCRLYFDDWDFDFIKVDYCGGAHMRLDEREQYTKIANAIKSCKKKGIVYNMCRWAYPGTWSSEVADSWRTTGDIYDAWKSVKDIVAENLYMSAYCHDGHYNDMDMLEVGRSMTQVEDETHFGLWCIMASPLLIGCDMAKIRPEALKLMCNRDLIALNQDPLHLQAYIAEKQGECFILVKDIKKLQGKERAVAIYNPSDTEQSVTLDPATIDLVGPVELYDCIAQQQLSTLNSQLSTFQVPAHGTKIYRVKGQKRLERTRYEAETAFITAYQELRNNQAEKSGIYMAADKASGGYVAGWLGSREDNDLQWRNVYVAKDGMRRLTVYYFCGEDREMNLEINGRPYTVLSTHSRNWDKAARISVDIPLRKGYNTIRLSNARGWMPDIDGITLSAL